MNDPILQAEKALFVSSNEDYCGLYEAIWELNTLFPDMALSEKYRLARAALELLMGKGLVQLERRTEAGQAFTYAGIEPKEAAKVLEEPTSWYPEYPEDEQVGFSCTPKGRDLWRERGAEGACPDPATGSGISIALYTLPDADDMHAAMLASVAEVGRWLGWCHEGYTLEEARKWVALQIELNRQGLAYEYVIRDSAGKYLGGCGVNNVVKAHRLGNLGYWLRTSTMGRGVAPAAARLVAERVFRETDLMRLEIVCAVGNVRSQRVAEKTGALREGVLRRRVMNPDGPSDAVLYSLVRG